MKYKVSISVIAFVLGAFMHLSAAQPEEVEKPSILADITADSIVVVIQDENIAKLLEFNPVEKKQDKNAGRIGYKVQVFSDNNVRTARNEARVKQRNIRARFPQHDSYVTYKQPYWRLRVGDFRTQEEAASFMRILQQAFPAYAREMRVVRDYIKLSKD